MGKPILCLDFDGVCHSYTSGWKGATVIPDPPVPGLFEFLLAAEPHFDIQIFSTRSNEPGGIEAMAAWIDRHWQSWAGQFDRDPLASGESPLVTFPKEKPPAFVLLDDRVLTFTGEWPSIETLKAFKAWNKK